MEITRKIFWTEAMKGGTIIGLVVIAFRILQMWVIDAAWLGWLSFAVFVLLVYGLTRRIARRSPARYGFAYDRCVGFTLAMMLFVGVLVGVYMSVTYRIMGTEVIASVIDVAEGVLAEHYSPAQVEAASEAAYKVILNPLVQVFYGILSYIFSGGLVGLFTGALAARKADIFAGGKDSANDGE